MNIAVIPARGGSKRIPRKNIKHFCGKPMIAWSIEAALASQCFDHIIVSTDDAEIAEIALQHGAEVPFFRPLELSDDYTGTVPVIKHAISWCQTHQINPAYVCCIYATAPFVKFQNLQAGLNQLIKEDCDYAFSVTSFAFPIQRALKITANNRIAMFQPEHLATRSQDLEEAWHDAGQFYWGTKNAWGNDKPLFSNEASPVYLPRYLVQDIDTEEDWLTAEYMFKSILEKA